MIQLLQLGNYLRLSTDPIGTYLLTHIRHERSVHLCDGCFLLMPAWEVERGGGGGEKTGGGAGGADGRLEQDGEQPGGGSGGEVRLSNHQEEEEENPSVSKYGRETSAACLMLFFFYLQAYWAVRMLSTSSTLLRQPSPLWSTSTTT